MRPPRSSRIKKASIRRSFAAVLAALAAPLCAACAVAPEKTATSPAQAPTSSPYNDSGPAQQPARAGGADAPRGEAELAKPATADEAMSELERWEREINQIVAARAGMSSKSAQSGPEPPPPPVTSPGAPRSAPSEAPLSAGDPCVTACRALQSMRRSADHVCGLVGDGDPRCSGARSRVSDAEGRVRDACPACS